MTTATKWQLEGARTRITVREWSNPDARYVAVLVHGYAEHSGRYQHVAERLVAHGGAVFAPDHLGHGESGGERVLIEDLSDVVDDLEAVVARAREAHTGLPLVLIGHSMGGIVATAYAQRGDNQLAALVLSGPAIGGNPAFESLLAMDPIPDVPIDPAILSRDPEIGRAYGADPLVWHGPFKRSTLEALFMTIGTVQAGPRLGTLPTLWLHGERDALAPLELTRAAIEAVRGDDLEEHIYPGALHEILNETNREEVLGDVRAFLDRVLARSPASRLEV
jgi:alpha-beta hydrolase superfamily lysophospholipase